ncbi:MAG TPA: hypothetical protein VEB59_14170 [Gemmatimonadales bacterium]|nr:hypothetical protein [Gemmatimonadales bacterium]
MLPAFLIGIFALTGAGPSAAQAGYPSGPPGAERYRLTLAALRRVLPVLRSPGQEQCEKREEKRDPFAMTLAEMTATIERCGPIQGPMAKAGVSSREAATVLFGFMYAARRITLEESALAMGNSAPPLPAGPLKDNVALLRENEAELRRLAQSPAAGNGP